MSAPKYRPFQKPVLRLDVHCHLGQGKGCFSPEERMALDRVLGIARCVITEDAVRGGAEPTLIEEAQLQTKQLAQTGSEPSVS